MAFSIIREDGSLDDTLDLSSEEERVKKIFEQSKAWQKHQETHKGASIADFEPEQVSHMELKIEPVTDTHTLQYDMNKKALFVGCNCGETFEINPRTEEVKDIGKMKKFEELNNSYKKDDDQGYGRSETNYNLGAMPQGNPSYGSNSRPRPGYNN